jgi:hypothetical protein
VVQAATSCLFGERLEAGGDVAHVCRAAEHDSVRGVEDLPIDVGHPVDGDDGHVGACLSRDPAATVSASSAVCPKPEW